MPRWSIPDYKGWVMFTDCVVGAVEAFSIITFQSMKQTQASDGWCGVSSPQFKFPSFRMWGKLSNQYPWPISSAKLWRLPAPRERPLPLHWKICKAPGPQWVESPSFTKGLGEQIKNQFPSFSSDSCGHFCWCQLHSPQLSLSCSYRDGWLSGLPE